MLKLNTDEMHGTVIQLKQHKGPQVVPHELIKLKCKKHMRVIKIDHIAIKTLQNSLKIGHDRTDFNDWWVCLRK